MSLILDRNHDGIPCESLCKRDKPMRHETINGQEAEICVIAADGTEVAEELRPEERGLLERIDTTLRADAGFCAACPGARLVRVDSNRGLGDGEEGL